VAGQTRERWGSYAGFLFAAIGSAVGIGNIWRFPYLVGTNGGGTFLLTYLLVIFTFGLAFMVLELLIGRYYQTSIVSALAGIRKRFRWVGIFMVAVTFAILSYYMVVLGWILSFFVSYLMGQTLDYDAYFGSLYPLVSFAAIAAVNYAVIRTGVRRGIERLSKYGVLLLIATIIPLAAIGMALPGAQGGLSFYLEPDVLAVSDPGVWATAIGQAFFSLSIGMGVLATYGSYLGEKRSLLSSSIIIIAVDTAVAFVAGLMVFSFVFSQGMDPAEGTTLAFQVMPAAFSSIEFGMVIGTLFFLLLLLAGVTSSVSMFQLPVATLQDTLKMSREKAAAVIGVAAFLAGLPSTLSYSSVGLDIAGAPFFDVLDTLIGTYGIAVAAVAFSLVTLWFIDRKKLIEQANMYNRVRIPAWLVTVVKVELPVLIIATVATQVIGT
jgi:NSS family neurotransmitter:Na+ symporter